MMFSVSPGIRSLASISNESLWLCESGDEIRSLDVRCNIRPDCHDESDERNCDHRKYCIRGAAVLQFHWLDIMNHITAFVVILT